MQRIPHIQHPALLFVALGHIWLSACGQTEQQPLPFRFAVISDSHVLDEFYQHAESTDHYHETLRHSNTRLQEVRDTINALSPAVDLVFHAGDIVHYYPSNDYQFYFEQQTCFDHAMAIFEGFEMPFYPALGNHDYRAGEVPKAVTHELVLKKFDIQPYYAVEHQGILFLLLNSQLGPSYTQNYSFYGSLGQEQLSWLKIQLERQLPTFIFIHYPLFIIASEEGELSLGPLLRTHRAHILSVISGHVHDWWNFSEPGLPDHYTVGSSRYDGHNYLLIEVDPHHQGYTIINNSQMCWMSPYSIGSQITAEECAQRH